MRRPNGARRFALGTLAWAAASLVGVHLPAQTAPAASDAPGPLEVLLGRALDLESANKPREAAALFRQVVAAPAAGMRAADTRLSALLGAERAYAEFAQSDSVLPLVALVLRDRPADPTVRTVQLRTLVTLRRSAEAREAYAAWRRATPGDVAPYREFARLLLAAGERSAADNVLRDAAVVTYARGGGGLRDLAPERAQVLAAGGAWAASAGAWRDALASGGPYEPAAVYSLQGAPDTLRAAVAGALLAPPSVPPARRAAATLLLRWRRPREAWAALAALLPDSAARAAWRDAAEQLAAAEAWGPARDAWTRVFETVPAGTDGDAGRRAAAAALAAGDAAGALARTDQVRARGASDPELALVRVRALGRLGRGAEAEREAAAAARAPGADDTDRAALAAAVADAWIASGDLARARVALAAGGPAAQQGPAAGWLALYTGDLRGARTLLRRTGDAESGDAAAGLTALTVLSRTRADSAPALGTAFLALARGDSARAAAGFEQAAAAVPDAAAPLLVAAARLRFARGEGAAAAALWRRVVAEYAAAPEAAEAELAWGRALAARGDRAGARAHLEHLIVTFAESALVPIARRELEALGSA